MHAIAFDTLRFAQRLRDEVNLLAEQAEKYAALMSDTITASFAEFQDKQSAATKADITASEQNILIAIEQSKADTLKWMMGAILGLAAFLYSVARLHA